MDSVLLVESIWAAFHHYQMENARVLVTFCHDGGLIRRLVVMIHHVVAAVHHFAAVHRDCVMIHIVEAVHHVVAGSQLGNAVRNSH